MLIDRFHLRGQQLRKFLGTKEGFYLRKVFNPHRILLVHQHGRCFIVLVHQYGRRDVMWKRSITLFKFDFVNVKALEDRQPPLPTFWAKLYENNALVYLSGAVMHFQKCVLEESSCARGAGRGLT